jgi:hypothetical protein
LHTKALAKREIYLSRLLLRVLAVHYVVKISLAITPIIEDCAWIQDDAKKIFTHSTS